MLFNKRKQAKQQRIQALDDSRLQARQRIDRAIEEAGRIKDPAEKLLKLDRLGREIGMQMNREYEVINKKAGKAGAKVGLGGVGVSIAAAAGATVATVATGGIGMLVIIPFLAGSVIASDKRENVVTEKLKEKMAGHLEIQKQQLARISEMMDAVIDSNAKEIITSPLYGDVLALPGLTKKFAYAAAKHIAPPKTPDTDAARSADAASKNLRMKKKARKQFKIKGV